MYDVMIDLETLGTGPAAAIMSIGAVKFDLKTLEIGPEFYARIDNTLLPELLGSVDIATVTWWLRQSNAAREGIIGPGRPLPIVLGEFAQFISGGGYSVWGNGADFDNVILRSAYSRCKLPIPWAYSANRCFRTARAMLPPVELAREGTHHSAIDDAMHQTRYLLKAYAAFRNVGRPL